MMNSILISECRNLPACHGIQVIWCLVIQGDAHDFVCLAQIGNLVITLGQFPIEPSLEMCCIESCLNP